MSTPLNIHVALFDTIHDPTLCDLWESLEHIGCATVFQSIAFVRSLEDTVVAERRGSPCYIALREGPDGPALMIVPLILRTMFGLRRIEFLDHGVADYHFPLVDPAAGRNARTASALRQALSSALPPHDVVTIGKMIREFRGTPNPLWDDRRMIETGEGASRLDLGEQNLARVRANHSVYAKVRKHLAKLRKVPGFEIVEARSAREIDSLFAAMIEQRRRRLAAKGASDALEDTAILAHYRRLAIEGCPSGKVIMFGLRVGTEWIATSYCLAHRDVVTGVLCSIDEGTYRRFSPGLIATVLEIEWAERKGFALYDFGAGTYGYKDSFGGRHRTIEAFGSARTLRGTLFLHAWTQRIALRKWLAEHPRLQATLRHRRQQLTAFGAALARLGGRDPVRVVKPQRG